jgi:hypothetical protein
MQQFLFHRYKMPRSSSSKPSHSSVKSSAPVVYSPPSSSITSLTPPAPTFGQTLKEGFAFGTGSALAHRFFNPFPTATASTTPGITPQTKKPCEAEQIAFETCLKTQSMDTFCGNEQLAYTSCIRLTEKH